MRKLGAYMASVEVDGHPGQPQSGDAYLSAVAIARVLLADVPTGARRLKIEVAVVAPAAEHKP